MQRSRVLIISTVVILMCIGLIIYINSKPLTEEHQNTNKLNILIKQEKWVEVKEFLFEKYNSKYTIPIERYQHTKPIEYYVNARIYDKNGDIVNAKNELDNIFIDKETEQFKTDILNFKKQIEIKYEPFKKLEEEKQAKLDSEYKIMQAKGREPSIGMTAEEVRNSKWGSPDDINRTTTAYGISEQWCYSGNRYVYLDNGIVTTIQD